MAITNNYGITLIEQAQAQKEVTINQALTAFDALLGNAVADKDLATPPGSPTAGVLYIVAASPTGAWAGKATQLTYFDQVWRFVLPQTNQRIWVADEGMHYKFNGTTWVAIAGGVGDVVGPASATDTAVARFNTTTGKLIQNSGVVIDASNNMRGIGTLASGNQAVTGTQTQTSNSASAFVVGASGATNPVLKINASSVSVATGVEIIGAAAAGGVQLNAISSGADETLTINAKGAGGLNLRAGTGANALTLGTNATTRFSLTNAQYLFSGLAASSSTSARFQYVATADTAMTASTDAPSVDWNLAATRQHATGALTLQRDFRIRATTHSAVAASTITDAATLAVDSAPNQGTNATITNSSAIYSAGAALGNGVTNSYGLNITASSGATNNYTARLAGSAGEIFRVRTDGQLALLATNTAAGIPGAQTIHRPSGTVNFAAAATSLVVTNSLCTTSSIVFAVVRTNDTTAVIKNVVPAAGSFTITLNAAATAETSVGFFIIN